LALSPLCINIEDDLLFDVSLLVSTDALQAAFWMAHAAMRGDRCRKVSGRGRKTVVMDDYFQKTAIVQKQSNIVV